MYSQKFVSHDKWGMSNPTHLYGSSEQNMAPTNFVPFDLPSRNKYERVTENFATPTNQTTPTDHNYRYDILFLLLVIMFVFFIERTFGKNIEELPILVKLVVICVLLVLIYIMY